MPDSLPPSRADQPRLRVDLHCHSKASNFAADAVLNAISCPESYSHPAEVYAQAKRRGMDLVTITDHDTIAGVQEIADRPDVLVGEEVTCWFPEDRCKIHLLVFGITPQQHEQLQSAADDIYGLARLIERERIAHSVAHPIYQQNGRLDRWHVERLLLLFKGFECRNGTHSALHGEAFVPMVDRLTPAEIERLSRVHGVAPLWPEPWIKARTAGSDDHGLQDIGLTWTEFPADATTTPAILDCLRTGRCWIAGQTGSGAKLAHMIYGVGVRYYARHLLGEGRDGGLTTRMIQTFAGERQMPTRAQAIGLVLKQRLGGIMSRVSRLWRRRPDPGAAYGTGHLTQLFAASAANRIAAHAALCSALERGLPPLGEHEEMFRFAAAINRDLTAGLAAALRRSIDDASVTGLFDTIGAVLGHQFMFMPYYLAFFHQNKERHLLRQITGQLEPPTAATMRVGLFTDTLDDINGVARFVRDMGEQAERLGRRLIIHTSTDKPRVSMPNRHNFTPLLSMPLPYYPQMTLHLPPLLEVLEWADRQQFDAIHVSTPGPVGLCGWMVSRMLRVPLLSTYHTDFPAYAEDLTRDHTIVSLTVEYMKWFYAQTAAVFSRSKAYHFNLHDLNVPDEKLRDIVPCTNTSKFNPRHRDPQVWQRLGVQEPRRLLYVGRVSVEKNLPLMVDVYRRLCAIRSDTALIVAGDGPYFAEMKRLLADLPARFLGYQGDGQLGPLYAGSDLFVFPSCTDTLGQVVMEAQASGVPVLVSDQGGPRELMDDGVTGLMLPGADPAAWCSAIADLLSDEPRRQRMARAAAQRLGRYSLENTFADFWAEHLNIVEPPAADEPADEFTSPPRSPARK